MSDVRDVKNPLQAEEPLLNQFFRGGLRWGSLCEIGLHSGQWGRSLVLEFLKLHSSSSLWIYPEGELCVYPPAWAARGLNLDLIHFMEYSGELSQLRSIFLESHFSIIVLDQPQKLSQGLLASWAALARKNGQIVFILRPYYLKQEKGNALVNYRLNVGFSLAEKRMHLFPIKGLSPQSLSLPRDLEY